MSVPEVGLIGDVGATNARFALVQADGSMRGLSTSSFTQIPSLLSDVRDGTHQVLRWLQPSKSWSREELARRVNRSGIPMIPALLVRASALCHTIAALFMEQRASRKWPRFIFNPYQYPTASR